MSKPWGFLLWSILSLIFFRIFDIFKPYPINLIDKKIKNGLGVILDDIIAGIYAALVLFVISLYTGKTILFFRHFGDVPIIDLLKWITSI